MHPPEASREHLKWPTLLKCRSRAVFLHSPRSFQRASEVAHVAKVPFARRIINIYWFRPCFVLRGLIFSCVFDTSVSKVMVPLSSSEWVLLGVLIFIWFRQRFWRFGGKWVLMQPLGVPGEPSAGSRGNRFPDPHQPIPKQRVRTPKASLAEET